MQQIRPEAKECDDFRPDPRLAGPDAPLAEIRFQGEMQETVEQGTGHGVADATLGGGIAGGQHRPSIRKPIIAQRAIEHELIAGSLRHRRRRGQLIEKEDAFSACGEKLGRDPFRAVFLDARQTAEIDGIKLNGPYVDKFAIQLPRDLLNELGFTDATGAPDMERDVLRHSGNQRLNEVRWFHEYVLG